MSALYLSMTASGNDQVVRCPRPADAIGTALRGTYGHAPGLPADIARLLQRLDRPR